MTVEVATTIAGLNETYPLATDPKSEGDDHIRLIKTILKSNLSNVNNTSDANKPVSTATQTALDAKANASDVATALNAKADLSGATFTGGVQFDSSALLKGTTTQEGASEAGYWFNHTGGGTNRKLANFQYIDGTFVLRYINDGYAGVAVTPLVVDSSGNATFSGSVAIQGAGLSQNGVNLPVGVTAGMTMTSATSHLAGNASVLRMAIADGSSPAGVSVHNIHDGTYSSQEVAISTSVGGIEPTTERLRFYKDGKILATNSPGFGYGAGSGGTVTQATSKSTAVTLNKPSGQITMHNAALAAGASVAFQVNNSTVGIYDSVHSGVLWSAIDGVNYRVETQQTGSGAFVIRVTNISGSSQSDVLVISFNVIKGSTT